MPNIIKYNMVIDNCDYTIDQLVQGVKSKNAYVERNIDRFQVKKGYYQKEIVVSVASKHQPSDLEEFADALFRFEHQKERKQN